jgi:hypothetical protein
MVSCHLDFEALVEKVSQEANEGLAFTGEN